jgi:hypothetical protein
MSRHPGLVIISLGLSVCDTVYIATMDQMSYATHNILGNRVKSVRDAQEEAKKDIQRALEQFGKVVSDQGGDLEATYKTFNSELHSSEDGAETVRTRTRDGESIAVALFSEWENELGQYSSADLRRKNDAKLTQAKARDKDMLGAMNRAERRIDPILRPLRDQVLYLKHNLNAWALAAIKGSW